MEFSEATEILKVLANPKRARIVDVIAEEEKNAKELLHYFQISQPTLSHDMKQLLNSGLVNARRDGKFIFYSVNTAKLQAFHDRLGKIFFGAGAHSVTSNDRHSASNGVGQR